jgi:two-component system cell cycle sensor histidine kinase PleC
MKIINKYRLISLLFFLLLSVTCLLTIVFCHSYIVNDILKYRIENHAINVSNYYYRDVVIKNIKGLQVTNISDSHEWINDINYVNYMIDNISFFLGNEAVQVKVRDAKGQVIFALDQFHLEYPKINNERRYNIFTDGLDDLGKIFFPRQFDHINYDKTLFGKIQSTIIKGATFRDSKGLLTVGTLAQVITPIIDTTSKSNNFTIGVIEFYYNITPSWERAVYMRGILITFVSLIFLAIIFHIRVIYNKFQNVIDVMLDLNNKLRIEKEESENENVQKTVFLSTISHELKTPLNAIIGYSDAIIMEEMGAIKNPVYKQYVEDISNISKYTISLVKDILDYAKATVDKLKMNNSCFDIRKVIIFCIKMVEFRAHQSAVKINLNLSTDSLPIMADQKRFKQCILNVLTNAIKYTPAGGYIKISATIDKTMKYDQIKIIFEDNGIGISQKELSKAIESFEKIVEVKSTKYEGTGLGLPFTRKLIENMGGKFEIESELGKGTKITFIFKYQDHSNT